MIKGKDNNVMIPMQTQIFVYIIKLWSKKDWLYRSREVYSISIRKMCRKFQPKQTNRETNDI